MSNRYAQCDDTCTVDCGHCKGEGPPADVTREPTGGQGLRETLASAVAARFFHTPGAVTQWCFQLADAVLPDLATLIADADNWRRVTTGDPTEPEPLAMQARELLVRNRELEATVARVRELAKRLYHDAWNIMADPAMRERGAVADLLGIALDGEPQP